MKKTIILLIISIFTSFSFAQTVVKVTTAGGFSEALSKSGGNAGTTSNLTVSGNIDARDIKFMNENMPLLSVLDIEAVQIKEYKKAPANELPECSFFNLSTKKGKTSLTKIKLPKNLISIGKSAFYNCSGLSGVLSLPNSLKFIGDHAFYGCKGLSGNLLIPNSVVRIGESAFYNCTGFSGSLNLSSSLHGIGKNAFTNCKGFTGSLNLPVSLKSIGDRSFYGCSGFNGKLTIPASFLTIGSFAFAECSGFTGTLTIPTSMLVIGEAAFKNCSGFSGNIVIPASVSSVGDGAFSGCSKISAINVDKNNTCLSEVDGVLFNKNKTRLIQYPSGKISDSYKIPSTVTLIEDYAFYMSKNLKGNLLIPNSVIYIGDYSFSNCSGLNSTISISTSAIYIGNEAFRKCSGLRGNLLIPNSVEFIGSFAFADCSSLTGSLIIPNSIHYIGWHSFENCSGISDQLYIPNSISSISEYAFAGCKGLKKIVASQRVPLIINPNIFLDINKSSCELVVPDGKKKLYEGSTGWKDFSKKSEAIFVFFNSMDGSEINDLIVKLNSKITEPKAPVKKNCQFAGWYKEKEYKNVWNFSKDQVTTNTTLYAKWTVLKK